MVSRILVLGGGSAGFLAALTLKLRAPHLNVTVLRSPGIGIIGVGEATTVGVPVHLHHYLKLDIAEFYRLAEPQWKLGIRFLWSQRRYFDYAFGYQLDTQYQILPKGTGFYCQEGPFDYVGIPSGLMTHEKAFMRLPNGRPLIGADTAYHIENAKFVHYLETVASRSGVTIQDDTVVSVDQAEVGVTGLQLESGRRVDADLYIDCSGFGSVLLGQALQEPFISFRPSLFNDRAIVGGWQRTDEQIRPYTTAETMDAGWSWRIDHERLINRGYVYSSDYISDEDAEREFRAKNPRIAQTRQVKFRTGRYQRAWVKNVVAMGNSAGFVEPLESTSLAAICSQAQALVETLIDCDGEVFPSLVTHFNKKNARSWDTIRQFLAIHFKFNKRLDTPYWSACRETADLADATEIVEYFQENGPSVAYRTTLIQPGDQFGMEGYLSMLVGQQVPYRRKYTPCAKALASWQSIREAIRRKTALAFSVREALDHIRSPRYQWPVDIYASAAATKT